MWHKAHYDAGISRICGKVSPVASRAMPDLAPDFSAGVNLAVLYINGMSGKTNAGGKVRLQGSAPPATTAGNMTKFMLVSVCA